MAANPDPAFLYDILFSPFLICVQSHALVIDLKHLKVRGSRVRVLCICA